MDSDEYSLSGPISYSSSSTVSYSSGMDKISLGVGFFNKKPEDPKVGSFVFNRERGCVELFTSGGWLELCPITDEMMEVLEKPSPEEDKKENIRRLFGRDLDI